nr:putative integron gene cassette protein [uncultured bacterium]
MNYDGYQIFSDGTRSRLSDVTSSDFFTPQHTVLDEAFNRITDKLAEDDRFEDIDEIDARLHSVLSAVIRSFEERNFGLPSSTEVSWSMI